MSYTKNNRIICDTCGLFCIPYDSETPFGCSSYDPPEPLDPYHYCKKCSLKLREHWFKALKDKNNWRYGYYEKSDAEMWAAKKLKIVWIHSGGLGVLGSKKNFADSYQYIPLKEYKRLSKLPYWGWCDICGKKRAGGYCSDKKCEKSFGYKEEQPVCNEVNVSEIPF